MKRVNYAMNEFDYDAMQKKKIAKGARNKKGSHGSRGCKLPYDYLTSKEKKGLNSTIMNYDFDIPMSWDDFKSAPNDIKSEYLNYLALEYGVSFGPIAKMFGIAYNTLWGHLKKYDITVSFPNASRISTSMKEGWAKYANLELSEPADVCVPAYPVEEMPLKEVKQKINNFTVALHGEVTVDDIVKMLSMVLSEPFYGDVEISMKRDDYGA